MRLGAGAGNEAHMERVAVEVGQAQGDHARRLLRPRMANTPTSGFRLPVELRSRLEAYAERMSADTGVTIRLSDVVRKLLTERLDQIDVEDKSRKPKK